MDGLCKRVGAEIELKERGERREGERERGREGERERSECVRERHR